ncbi:hypothetical protein Tco_0593379 [Tanacetum coccineum]
MAGRQFSGVVVDYSLIVWNSSVSSVKSSIKSTFWIRSFSSREKVFLGVLVKGERQDSGEKCGALTNKCGGFEELMQVHLMDFNYSIFRKMCCVQCYVSTAGAAVTTAGASISTASPPRVSTAEDISTAETLVYIRRSAAKDKAAVRLQDQLDEEERKRIDRVHEEASSFNIEEWDDIQATIEADEELAQRIQAEEREKYSEAEKARLLAELINQRKRYFA